jgi:hypothetical protein
VLLGEPGHLAEKERGEIRKVCVFKETL